VTAAQLKLHGIKDQEDALQLEDQERNGRSKLKRVRKGQNGPSLCG